MERSIEHTPVRDVHDLLPGEYVFRVQGSNNHGVWNEHGVSVRIRILPPWWSTRWFPAIVAASFLLSLWCAYYLHLTSVKRRHAEIRALDEQLIKGLEAGGECGSPGNCTTAFSSRLHR